LPEVRVLFDSNIQAAYEGDPATRSSDEMLVCCPGIAAIIHHRLAYILYQLIAAPAWSSARQPLPWALNILRRTKTALLAKVMYDILLLRMLCRCHGFRRITTGRGSTVSGNSGLPATVPSASNIAQAHVCGVLFDDGAGHRNKGSRRKVKNHSRRFI